MSTNWDKFDAEKALQEIDLEDDRKEKLKNTKVAVKQQEKSLEETKRKAEILATKVRITQEVFPNVNVMSVY